MSKDNLHTLERIDVKNRLPRNGSMVLCWGHLRSYGWRWVHILRFDEGRFTNPDVREHDPDEGDYTEYVTHWAHLEALNWNDGLPLHRSYVQ